MPANRKHEQHKYGSREARGYDYEHRKWRNYRLKHDFYAGMPCPKCSRPIPRREDADLGHIIALAMGGPRTLENTQLECRPCNRSEGAHIGNAMRRAGMPPRMAPEQAQQAEQAPTPPVSTVVITHCPPRLNAEARAELEARKSGKWWD
jgi:5-methylcytosine-specific restriction endonuclease McrA